jgi:hypothetical protein
LSDFTTICAGSGKPWNKDPSGFLVASGYCAECADWILDDPRGSGIAEVHEALDSVVEQGETFSHNQHIVGALRPETINGTYLFSGGRGAGKSYLIQNLVLPVIREAGKVPVIIDKPEQGGQDLLLRIIDKCPKDWVIVLEVNDVAGISLPVRARTKHFEVRTHV